MTAYIYLNEQKDPDFVNTANIIKSLCEENIICILPSRLANKVSIEDAVFMEEEEAITQCDIVVTIGGDGTILHAASLLFENEKPILGINLGRVGFLALTEPTELNLFKKLIKNEYSIEKRALIDIYLNGEKVGTALNELLVSQGMLSTAIELELYCDNVLVNTYRADGILIATPTGSTAYSLSAGGPVVDTKMAALLATPICAHSLYSPSIVFSEKRKIDIKMSPNERTKNFIATIDGHVNFNIEKGDIVSVQKSNTNVNLINFGDSKQFSSIDTKLKWR
jgi:Predicted sugar kinase